MDDDFESAEGGVKIVFDVPESDVRDVEALVAAAGLVVHRYYDPADQHRPGGSAAGYVRLGAERSMRRFTDAEVDAIVTEFDEVQARADFTCVRVGTDSWTAGGGGRSGDREPRVPLPKSSEGAAAAGRRQAAPG